MKGMQVIDRNIEVEGIRVASAASGKSDQPYGGLQLHQMAQVRQLLLQSCCGHSCSCALPALTKHKLPQPWCQPQLASA